MFLYLVLPCLLVKLGFSNPDKWSVESNISMKLGLGFDYSRSLYLDADIVNV